MAALGFVQRLSLATSAQEFPTELTLFLTCVLDPVMMIQELCDPRISVCPDVFWDLLVSWSLRCEGRERVAGTALLII